MPRKPTANRPRLAVVPVSMPESQSPPPPSHLSPSMTSWWRTVCEDYALEDHHLRLLEAACGAWDRMTEARELLKSDGLTFTDDKGMIRAHPAAAIERDNRTAFARLLRELDLDCEPPVAERSRPPALRSNRR